MNNYNMSVTNLLLFTNNASLKVDLSSGNQLNKILLYLFFPQMKPEKKALELSDSEKTIFELVKKAERIDLGELKSSAGLSGKQWDKGMKGLNKQGLIKVEVEGDSKMVLLKA